MSTGTRGARNRHHPFPAGSGRSGNNGGGNNSNGSGNKSKWNNHANPTSPTSPTGASSAGSERSSPNMGGGAHKERDAHMMHQHDRALFLLMHLVGTNVKVTVKGGIQYEGIFHAAATEGELGIVLKMARRLPGSGKSPKSNGASPSSNSDALGAPAHTLVILAKDLMQVDAVGMDFTVPPAPATTATLPPKQRSADGFKTDVAISGGGAGGQKSEPRERALRKWADYLDDEELPELDDWMASSRSSPGAGAAGQPWDQFEANKKLFGLRTDYNEEIYTTRLDRSKPDYKEREKAAIRLANEIMRSTTDNVHMAEERNQVVPTDDLDEEDRYGAVLRSPQGQVPGALGGGKGKYQPPQSRAKTTAPPHAPIAASATTASVATVVSGTTAPRPSHPLVVKQANRQQTTSTQSTAAKPSGSTSATAEANRKLTSSQLSKLKSELLKGMPKIEETLKKTNVVTPSAAPEKPAPEKPAPAPVSHPLVVKASATNAVSDQAQIKLPAMERGVSIAGAATSKSPVDQLRPGTLSRSTSSSNATGGTTPVSDESQKALRSAILARIDKKLHADRAAKKPIETQVMGTFRKFASTEKERLQQKKQALIRKEKDTRIAALVQFSKSFQLKNPMPEDMVDLVTRDPEKRKQLLESPTKTDGTTMAASAETAAKPAESKEAVETAGEAKPTVSEPTPSDEKKPAVKETATAPLAEPKTKPESDTKPEPAKEATVAPKTADATKELEKKKPVVLGSKLNANASEFRPNPAAAPFVPGAAKKPVEPAYNPFFADKQLIRGKTLLRELYPSMATGSDVDTDTDGSCESTEPTWQLGDKTFRQQFQLTNAMEEAEMYPPAMMPPQYGFAYPMAPYRYPAQFVPGMPPMAMAPGSMPYMAPPFAPPVPFSPPLGHAVPPQAMYGSPQMAPAAVPMRPGQSPFQPKMNINAAANSATIPATSATASASSATSPDSTSASTSQASYAGTPQPLQPNFSPATAARQPMISMQMAPHLYAYHQGPPGAPPMMMRYPPEMLQGMPPQPGMMMHPPHPHHAPHQPGMPHQHPHPQMMHPQMMSPYMQPAVPGADMTAMSQQLPPHTQGIPSNMHGPLSLPHPMAALHHQHMHLATAANVNMAAMSMASADSNHTATPPPPHSSSSAGNTA